MREEDVLSRLPRRHRNLALGIGDDCAVYRPGPGEELVFTTDWYLEGVHFQNTRRTSADTIGRNALARSLSDIAAMGAAPRFCLVSLAVPKRTRRTWLDRFFDGILNLCSETGTALAGGDLSHNDRVLCDAMVCGSVARGKALRRDGARPGDYIYVSGALGGWRHRGALTPRLDIGRRLVGRATACMDISDGLALDLHRLCVASGIGAALDHVPLLPGATLSDALHDGEDYELLYTAPRDARVPGTRIGAATGDAGRITLQGKRVPPRGYEHFRNRP